MKSRPLAERLRRAVDELRMAEWHRPAPLQRACGAVIVPSSLLADYLKLGLTRGSTHSHIGIAEMTEHEVLVAVRMLEETLESMAEPVNGRRNARSRVLDDRRSNRRTDRDKLASGCQRSCTEKHRFAVIRAPWCRRLGAASSLTLDADQLPSLVLFGKTGRVFASLGSVNGSPHLLLGDASGKPRINVGLSKTQDARRLTLRRRGNTPIGLGLGEQDIPLITLRDRNNRDQLALRVSEAASPQLTLSHPASGKIAVSLQRHETGGAVLVFADEKEEKHVIGITDNGLPFEVLHSDGKPRLHLSILQDGTPFLNFYNAEGRARLGLRIAKEPPASDSSTTRNACGRVGCSWECARPTGLL